MEAISDDIESALYIWDIIFKQDLNNLEFNKDTMIIDVSEVLDMELEVPDISLEVKHKLLSKMLLKKFINPDYDILDFMIDNSIHIMHENMILDFMNKTSYYLDSVINFYSPYTNIKSLYSDLNLLSPELTDGIIIKDVNFMYSKNDICKLHLTLTLYRKKGLAWKE